jgi:hypothetical protein
MRSRRGSLDIVKHEPGGKHHRTYKEKLASSKTQKALAEFT